MEANGRLDVGLIDKKGKICYDEERMCNLKRCIDLLEIVADG